MGKQRKQPKTRGNKYAHMSKPQAELDFHDEGVLTREEICDQAAAFIRQCSERGMKKVLIITGKGLHSDKGPVIRPLLKDFLPRLPQVQSVAYARRDRGGEGALEIDLH